VGMAAQPVQVHIRIVVSDWARGHDRRGARLNDRTQIKEPATSRVVLSAPLAALKEH